MAELQAAGELYGELYQLVWERQLRFPALTLITREDLTLSLKRKSLNVYGIYFCLSH